MVQNVVSSFDSSSLMMTNIIKAGSPNLRQVGSIFYVQPEGIQFVGTIAYVVQYVNIGSNFNALA